MFQNIGRFYETGTVVYRDVQYAMKWYRSASEEGDSFLYAYALFMGIECEKDEESARRIFAKVNQSELVPASIGFMHEFGLGGFRRSVLRAVNYYRENNDHWGRHQLQRLGYRV